jgi:cation transport protein ChaC
MKLTAELVALCERAVDDPGPDPDLALLTDGETQAFAEKLAGELDGAPLWLFAYGSLIWKPAFDAIESRRGIVRGWHRAFAMEMTRWRGTPEAPGLMMVIDRGGICHGVAYRLPDGGHCEQIHRMIERETEYRGDLDSIRWIGADTEAGRVKALAFWATPRHGGFGRKLTPEETARRIAQACGHSGSNAAYLYQTVSKLDELGIRDRNLWRLQELVADEIVRQHGDGRASV